MKNKEIEDILKNIKYAIDEDDYWEVTKETLIPLLSYIEQLEEEIHKEEAMYDSLAVDYRLSQEQNEQLEKENKKYKDLGFEHLCKRNEQLERENQQLKKQKDGAFEYIKHYINFRKDIYPYIDMREFDLDKLLRMLGEKDEQENNSI